MHFSDVEVGKQLIVGEGTYYDCLGLGRKAIRGSAYIEGPFLLGDARSFSEKVLATAMIARDVNNESNTSQVDGDIPSLLLDVNKSLSTFNKRQIKRPSMASTAVNGLYSAWGLYIGSLLIFRNVN